MSGGFVIRTNRTESMKRAILFAAIALVGSTTYAQQESGDEQGQLKISGYIQTQWTWDEAGIESGKQNDLSLRRGRLTAAYTNIYGEAVVQVNIVEKGVDVIDAYLKAKSPKIKWGALRAGIFVRPFGYEIDYSSSRREAPENSRVFRTLFPKDRDIGAEVILRGPEETFLKDVTLNAGLFAGNGGQAKETDSGKDFIGHLVYAKSHKNINIGLGASLYYGGVRLAGEESQKAYKLAGGEYVQDESLETGDYANRHYFGVDGQFSLNSAAGTTKVHAEYLWGKQPGASEGSMSPTGAITSDIYCRNFSGYYIQLVQDIGKSKHAVVAKLDGYDPNTKLSKDECLTAGDVAYTSFGFGWLFRANKNLKVTAYYELTSNEKVNKDALPGYSRDIDDDIFTLRLQYKF